MGRQKLFVALVAASVGFLGAPIAAEAEPSGEVVGDSGRASTSLPEPPAVEPLEPSVQHPVRPSQVNGSRLEDLPMVELTDLRDARSRTFEHPGGARTIDAYAEPIHYEDQHGSWLPIDNTLRDEPARPSWTFTSSAVLPLQPASTGAISTYRATAGSMPIATHAGATGLLTDSHPVPQVTTTSGASHLVHISGFAGATTASPPAGTTQRAAVSASASLLVADRLQVDPGASPAGSVTTSGLFNSASVTIAISAVNTRSLIAFDGHSDNPQFTAAPTGGVTDFTIPLAGGALFTWNDSNGYEISHTNWHGDTVTITDLNGDRVWTGITGPHGEQASTSKPTNSGMDGVRWGWHAADQRMTDRTITQMGARPYSPEHGRFLSVDPIEGGCANDYAYVYGDPLNTNDIYGTNWLTSAWDATGGKLVSVIASQVMTCQDTGFTRVTSALSLIPTTASGGGSKRAVAGNAAGWSIFNTGQIISAVAKGHIGNAGLNGVTGTIVRVGSRLSNIVTLGATSYDAARRYVCRGQ